MREKRRLPSQVQAEGGLYPAHEKDQQKDTEAAMKGYRTFKTTLGHKYRVRMDAEERAEKELFTFVQIITTSIGTLLLMIVWLMR